MNALFALVCGQAPAHTWAPGGMLLPVCERCTGLYVGAAVALALHLALRIGPSARFLQVHGGFLLLMIPLGYHWLPQDPLARTASGVLFGAGLVSFLAGGLRPAGPPLAVARGLRPTQAAPSLSRGGGPSPHSAPAARSLARARSPQTLGRLQWVVYLVGIGCALLMIPLLASEGGPIAWYLLSGFAAIGLASLVALTLANVTRIVSAWATSRR
jgi:uncharacterized membrane protein